MLSAHVLSLEAHLPPDKSFRVMQISQSHYLDHFGQDSDSD